MGLLSPAPKTSLTEAQALGVLQAALGPSFTQAGLLLVAAQSAVETARWSAMYGWNFGNVTPTAAQAASGDYFMHPSTGMMKYVAYSTPAAGAKAMVSWLQSHGALAAAQTGDLAGYMTALQNGSYLGTVGLTDASGHTVSQQDYTNYQNAIAALVSELGKVQPVAFNPVNWGLIGGVALAGAGAAYYWREALLHWVRT